MAHSLAVRPSGGPRTWTVVDEGYRTVGPVEEWLEAHRQLWSPNTVRGYATSLAQWWTFLEQRGESGGWGEVGVAAVSGRVRTPAQEADRPQSLTRNHSHRAPEIDRPVLELNRTRRIQRIGVVVLLLALVT
ncbi:MAG: hypothetical protein ACRDS0_11390 [Pseudonocardiaceae bacterium]